GRYSSASPWASWASTSTTAPPPAVAVRSRCAGDGSWTVGRDCGPGRSPIAVAALGPVCYVLPYPRDAREGELYGHVRGDAAPLPESDVDAQQADGGHARRDRAAVDGERAAASDAGRDR